MRQQLGVEFNCIITIFYIDSQTIQSAILLNLLIIAQPANIKSHSISTCLTHI